MSREGLGQWLQASLSVKKNTQEEGTVFTVSPYLMGTHWDWIQVSFLMECASVVGLYHPAALHHYRVNVEAICPENCVLVLEAPGDLVEG